MIEYVPFVEKTSQTEGYTEVKFTIRKFSHGLRSRIRRQLAPSLAKIRELNDKITQIVDEFNLDQSAKTALTETPLVIPLSESGKPEIADPSEGSKFSIPQMQAIEHIGDIENEIQIVTASDVDIVWLKEGLIKLEGISMGGKPVDAQWLYEQGPELLCKEIVTAIKAEAGLIAEVKENLRLPSTSGAAVDGETNGTNAPGASEATGTKPETAEGITLIK